jgi:sulfur-carrier protein adenylyltransferase/sulfurtransferase
MNNNIRGKNSDTPEASSKESTLRANTNRSKSTIKLWLGLSVLPMIIITAAFSWIAYNPETLKPLIQSGLPLNSLSKLPILGDAIQTAQTPEITVQELKKLIDNKANDYILVDVRTPEEYYHARIPGAILVTATEIEDGTGISSLKYLLKGQKLITYCSIGKRSSNALAKLKQVGIEGTNLKGGIKAWRQEIDSSMPEI